MEDGDEGVHSILQKFSILAEGILSIWEGENSVRRRIEVLAERQQVMKDEIRGAEEVQRDLRVRLCALEEQGREEQASLQCLKQERLHALAQAIKAGSIDAAHLHRSPTLSGSSQLLKQHYRIAINKVPHPHASAGPPSQVRQHGANSAATILSARQIVAFEMLEFAHERLTSHMWAHMCEKVRGMQTEEEKGEYLRIFRGVEARSAFGTKPLSEATYAELLDHALKKEAVEVEVQVTLEAAERRLVEEASRAGYGGGQSSIGNIRMQMLVYLQCHRHFKSATAQQRVALGFKMCINQPDIISQTESAARLGQLGALQPASQLIQLACFFLSKV